MKIVVIGGTALIGSKLVGKLIMMRWRHHPLDAVGFDQWMKSAKTPA